MGPPSLKLRMASSRALPTTTEDDSLQASTPSFVRRHLLASPAVGRRAQGTPSMRGSPQPNNQVAALDLTKTNQDDSHTPSANIFTPRLGTDRVPVYVLDPSAQNDLGAPMQPPSPQLLQEDDEGVDPSVLMRWFITSGDMVPARIEHESMLLKHLSVSQSESMDLSPTANSAPQLHRRQSSRAAAASSSSASDSQDELKIVVLAHDSCSAVLVERLHQYACHHRLVIIALHHLEPCLLALQQLQSLTIANDSCVYHLSPPPSLSTELEPQSILFFVQQLSQESLLCRIRSIVELEWRRRATIDFWRRALDMRRQFNFASTGDGAVSRVSVSTPISTSVVQKTVSSPQRSHRAMTVNPVSDHRQE